MHFHAAPPTSHRYRLLGPQYYYFGKFQNYLLQGEVIYKAGNFAAYKAGYLTAYKTTRSEILVILLQEVWYK